MIIIIFFGGGLIKQKNLNVMFSFLAFNFFQVQRIFKPI